MLKKIRKACGQLLIFSIMAMAIFFTFSIALLCFERTINNVAYSFIYSQQAYYHGASGINYLTANQSTCSGTMQADFNLRKANYGFDGYIGTNSTACDAISANSTGYYSPDYTNTIKDLDFSNNLNDYLPQINVWICGDNITDARDGYNYKTNKIYNQCWMAQNLNATKFPNGTLIPAGGRYCYGGFPGNCTIYGALYTWNTTMANAAGCNGFCVDQASCAGGYQECRPYVQGICPDGWHVPSHFEWNLFEQYAEYDTGVQDTTCPYDITNLGGYGSVSPVQGIALRNGASQNFDYWGFNGLLAGMMNTTGGFNNLTTYGYFWSSTDDGSGANAWYRYLTSGAGNNMIYRYTGNTSNAFSVRCIKNQ